MNKITSFILITLMSLISNLSWAQLSFDRTRVIFDHKKSNSQSVVISNTNNNTPYLAQTWIENDKGKKINTPLTALPILQRVNPAQEKQIKISMIGDTTILPTDRESLFYFNVLGVPPKEGTSDSQVNIILQSKLKLFYRPKGLPNYKTDEWLQEIQLLKTGDNLTIKNPTAYHAVIYGFSNKSNRQMTEKDLIIQPFNSQSLNIPSLGKNVVIYFVGDFGGGIPSSYSCDAHHCVLDQ